MKVNFRGQLLAKTVLAGVTSLSAVAFATPAAFAQAAGPESRDVVVVTGSRIARENANAESPLVAITAEDITESGHVTLDHYLNTLPQITPGLSSQSNNPSSNGRAFIDLRGLGSNRNLILIDGRRGMGSTGGGVVDVNTIPAALLERVEVVTGGAASTYGADAVAGVINFILKKDFEGVAIDSQYRVTEEDDGVEWGTDLTFGGAFAEGRGHAVFNASYFSRDALYKDARPFSAQASATTSIFPGGSWAPGAATPTQAAVNAAFGPGNCAANGGWAGFGFNPDGSLFCTGVANNTTQNIYGYTGPDSAIATAFAPNIFSYNFEPDNILVLPMERWSLYSHINYDVNKHFRPYATATYTNYNALQELAPTPAGGTTGWNVPVTNPFIPAAMRTLLASRSNPTAPFAFSKRFNDLGGRTGYNTHDVWQVTTGAEGEIFGTWGYDVYASFGRSVQNEIQGGNVRRDRVGQLLESPTVAAQATLSGGACPNGLNLFGAAAIDPTCAAWISLEAKNLTVIEQAIVEATISGDLFTLPAGAVQAAFGLSYRELDFDFKPDGGLQPGLVAGFNQQLPVSGYLDYADAFAEFYIPILSDLPLIDSFAITTGFRVSDNNNTGSNNSWKVNGDWTINDFLRARGGFQTAVRAPTVNELYAPQLNNFPAFTGQDPCDTTLPAAAWNRQGPNGAQVTALCTTQSVVAGGPSFVWLGQANGITGGNPNLQPETAESFTIGFVAESPFTNPWLQGLYGSVDYWSIEMEDVIAAVGASTIVQRCFNRDGANPTYSPTNEWCQLFRREPSNGSVIELAQLSRNQAFTNTSGVDVVLGYGLDFNDLGIANGGQLDFNWLTTWVERYETQTSVADPMNDYVGTIGTGTGSATPEWRSTLTTSYSREKLRLALTTRWIEGMKHSATVTGGSPITNKGTPTTFYLDLTGNYHLTDSITLRGGVNNLLNQEPRLYTPNIQSNTDPSTYDVLGRRYFVGVNVRF